MGKAAKNRRSNGKWEVKEKSRAEWRWVAEGLDEDLDPQPAGELLG